MAKRRLDAAAGDQLAGEIVAAAAQVEVALHGLQGSLRRFEGRGGPDGPRPPSGGRRPVRGPRLDVTADGMILIDVELQPDEAAIVLEAIEAARRELPTTVSKEVEPD